MTISYIKLSYIFFLNIKNEIDRNKLNNVTAVF